MLTDNFCWDILDIYFQKGSSQDSVNPLIKHQIDSYNKFLDGILSQIITGFNPIKINLNTKGENESNIQKISINVLQPSLTKPSYQLQDGTNTIMTPHIARMNNLTYSSNLYVNVHIVIELLIGDNIIEKIDKTVSGVYIGKIPIMVRSKACVLYQIPGLGEEDNNECKYDFGGYFIINGNEKVLICQDRINENTTLVFQPNNNSDGLYAEIRSMCDNIYLPPKTTSLNMSGKLNHMGRIIRLNTSFLRSEIPIFVMFRALGIISDKEIIQHIVYDLDNKDNQRIINELMACCEDAYDINNQEQAEQVLIKIMTGVNKNQKSIELLHNNIMNDFLPHVGKCYRRKALYLGYMIRKMIRIYLGYDGYDNRDSYINKRIDTPGILMSNLFRQCYGKMTKEIKNLIERELNLWRANQITTNADIISDNNIHRYFKQSLLDSWLKYSLSTGNWGIKSIGTFQNIRQGVSQVLNRMSYASTLSHLRRINTAMEKNGKLVQPRKLDNSQIGMICPAETPEGASVGLVKNMALSTNISVSMCSIHIRKLVQEFGTIMYNDSYNYNEKSKNKTESYLKELGNVDNVYIQINGDIIGYHTNPVELYNTLKNYKRCGIIYPMTSIVWNIRHRYIAISTEAGRMYRPLLIVDYDKSKNKSELRINRILREKNISWNDYIKDKAFDYFICPMTNDNEEGFIEYLDCNEINYAMIAMNPAELEKGMKGSAYPPRYTNCEIHPSLINGILGVNIPFSDHNQSPRNCYQCISQNELVLMSDGTSKFIKDIKIGDEVICFNPITKKSEYTSVVNHYNRKTTKYIYNLITISGRTITATYDHKFMTSHGWKTCDEINHDTKIGIMMMSHFVDNSTSNEYNILNQNDNYFGLSVEKLKLMDLFPLTNKNKNLSIIARLCGYSLNSNNKFNSDYDMECYNNDVIQIGFTNGYHDTLYQLYIEHLILTINNWIPNCSKLVKKEFVAGYCGSISNNNYIKVIEDILHDEELNNEWYNSSNEIKAIFYNKFGIRYNYDLMKELSIINEFIMYNSKKYSLNIKTDYSYDEWKEIIEVQGHLIFVPFHEKFKNTNNNISDITVASESHSFIGGNGFAISNCAMGKQALGVYMSNFNKRIDTMGNILNYPQKPLVHTKLSKYTYSNELPAGVNVVVAIMTHTGFNQEDSIMINQSALDRGLFTSTYYKAFRDQCTKNHSTGEEEVFINPSEIAQLKPFSYKKLNEDGFIPKNTYIDGNDILVGKVMPKKQNGKIIYQDNSTCMKANDEGHIDLNYTGTNSDGYKFCKIRIRKNRKPEIGDKLACYSPDHEYLTTDGWIPVAELTLKHKVASMVDGKLIYQNPIELHEYDHKGKMYSLKSNQVNLLITPNHRMLYRPKHENSKWNIKKAEEIYNTKYKMKKNVDEWIPDITNDNFPSNLIITDGQITHFKFDAYTDGNNKINPELIIDIDSWLTFYGIYIAEGSVAKYSISIAANKPRVQEALDKASEISGIKINKNMSKGELVKWHLASTHMANLLGYKQHTSITKYLQEWVWYLNREQCQKLIHAMCLGDGGMMENGTWRYYTSSTKLADDFQRLCLHGGYSCNKKLKTPKGTRNILLEEAGLTNGKESYTNADYWVLTIITSQNEPLINKNIVSSKHPKFDENVYHDNYVDYEGKVYCCTLKKGDGIVYVRREGMSVWSGNSRMAQKGSIGMVYNHQDMPFTKDGIVPDVIMNPHAIPSRMTIAQLLECIMGKACCHIGAYGDSTPFTDCSVESIAKVLEMSGMERYGNEIMYNGRTGEQIKTEIFIGPTYYQRLKHMVSDKLHCLTEDHDVLTTEGWIPIKKVSINHEVAILKDNKLVYERPLKVYQYPDYNGKMYKIENDEVDLNVTLNHRMYVKIDDKYQLEKAENIIGKNLKYKKTAEWEADDYQFILPSYKEKICGFFTIKNYKEEKINMEKWLIIVGVWIASDYTYKNNNKQIDNYFKSLNKNFPDWIWKLSKNQARILVNSISSYSTIYYTGDKNKLDNFMRLLLHTGWYGIINKIDNVYKIIIIKDETIENHSENKEEVYDYNGSVYCLKVSSEIFMVRRNNVAVWTGNSRGSNGPIVMLTRQCSEGRARNGGLRLGEMERDCFIGHGSSLFLKEKMLDSADNYRVFICKNCGMIANVNPDKNIYKCNYCKNSSDIVQIRIPYAFKLLNQELYTMNVLMRFVCN